MVNRKSLGNFANLNTASRRATRIYSPYQQTGLGYDYRASAAQTGAFNITPWLRKAGSIIGPALTSWSEGEKPLKAVAGAVKKAIFKKKAPKKKPKAKKKTKAKKAKRGGFKKVKL